MGPKTIRCKFVCQSVTKSKHFNQPKDGETKFLFNAKFHAVMDGNEENKKFFEYTPTGSIEIGTYKDDHFTPGHEYFVDIVEVTK